MDMGGSSGFLGDQTLFWGDCPARGTKLPQRKMRRKMQLHTCSSIHCLTTHLSVMSSLFLCSYFTLPPSPFPAPFSPPSLSLLPLPLSHSLTHSLSLSLSLPPFPSPSLLPSPSPPLPPSLPPSPSLPFLSLQYDV